MKTLKSKYKVAKLVWKGTCEEDAVLEKVFVSQIVFSQIPEAMYFIDQKYRNQNNKVEWAKPGEGFDDDIRLLGILQSVSKQNQRDLFAVCEIPPSP